MVRAFRVGLALGPFAARRAVDQATIAEPVYIVADDPAFLASLDVASVSSEELAAHLSLAGGDHPG